MGRILMIEFDDRNTAMFDEIMRRGGAPGFGQFRVRAESTLSLSEPDIFLQRRKAYSGYGYTENPLTAKEFDILCMLVANKGIAHTYDQIYHRLWMEDSAGNVSNTVGCHICSLKLNKEYPNRQKRGLLNSEYSAKYLQQSPLPMELS